MTSVVRNLSQVGPRIGYFYAVSSTTAYDIADAEAVMTTSPDSDYSVNSGTLLKDMGKFVVVADSTTGLHTALYRKVQKVDGAEAEGVPNDFNTTGQFYVKVWSANGSGVTVVRTG